MAVRLSGADAEHGGRLNSRRATGRATLEQDTAHPAYQILVLFLNIVNRNAPCDRKQPLLRRSCTATTSQTTSTPMAERTPNTLARRAIDRADPEDRRRYVAGLETAFGTWGDYDRFAWAFDRSCGAGPADLAVLVDPQGRWVAGSAVTYRLVRAPSGEVEAAGIMTSSWTLPAARGRGCLTHFVEWSREMARARGSGLLFAFMTDTNPSRRRLAAAGADLVPTWYASWDAPGGGEAPRLPSPSGDQLARLAERAPTPVSDAHTITYPDADAWAGQFLRRPDPVEVVAVPGGCAVIECAVGTDRLLAAIADDRAARPLDPAAVLATLTASAARRGGSRAGTGCERHGHDGQRG